MLHVCGSLFMFVHGDRFVNPWHEPACPAGGVSFWMTRQGSSDVGENINSMEGTITALDGTNVQNEEVTTVTRTKIVVVVGPLTTATEMGNHTYILNSPLEETCPIMETIIPLVN